MGTKFFVYSGNIEDCHEFFIMEKGNTENNYCIYVDSYRFPRSYFCRIKFWNFSEDNHMNVYVSVSVYVYKKKHGYRI